MSSCGARIRRSQRASSAKSSPLPERGESTAAIGQLWEGSYIHVLLYLSFKQSSGGSFCWKTKQPWVLIYWNNDHRWIATRWTFMRVRLVGIRWKRWDTQGSPVIVKSIVLLEKKTSWNGKLWIFQLAEPTFFLRSGISGQKKSMATI